MKILLDTQCWLWWFAQPERLNEQAIALMADETNELWFSVASIWEIAIKVANGKWANSPESQAPTPFFRGRPEKF